MHPFETVIYNAISRVKEMTKILQLNHTSQILDLSPDFTGGRVQGYIEIITFCDLVDNGIRQYLNTYNTSQDKYKYCDNIQDCFKTQGRNHTVKRFATSYEDVIVLARRFQNNAVLQWNEMIPGQISLV